MKTRTYVYQRNRHRVRIETSQRLSQVLVPKKNSSHILRWEKNVDLMQKKARNVFLSSYYFSVGRTFQTSTTIIRTRRDDITSTPLSFPVICRRLVVRGPHSRGKSIFTPISQDANGLNTPACTGVELNRLYIQMPFLESCCVHTYVHVYTRPHANGTGDKVPDLINECAAVDTWERTRRYTRRGKD